jgi:hypothetical protein
MGFDLSQHMPVPHDNPSGFVEAGHRFKAWQPASEAARRVLVIQAWKEGDEGAEPVREVEVPMWHPNIFGPDVEDMEALERATDRLIRELSDVDAAGPRPSR